MNTKFSSCIFAVFTLFVKGYSFTCVSPWQFSHGNHCYLFERNPTLTWGEARVSCFGYGGYLAIIDNADEWNATTTYHNKHFSGMWYWLGGTDFGTEGIWHWDHTGKVITNNTYSNWYAHGTHVEPNGRRNENCLMTFGAPINSQWNDFNCDNLLAYLCEKD